MARYLVVAHQTAGSPELRKHVGKLVNTDPSAEFTVLVPATPVSHLFTWSEEETLSNARRNMERSAELLRDAGANVSRSIIGSRFPVDAIQDELRTSPGYDHIVICTFPPGISRWLKRDLINQVKKRSHLPITHIIARPRVSDRTSAVGEAVAAAVPEAQPVGAGVSQTSSFETETATAPVSEPPPADAQRPGLNEEELAALDLPDIERDDLPSDEREIWDRLVEGRDVANLFRVMGHSRVLLQAYVEMLNALWAESGLDDQTRELVILRTAILQRSEYVWHHHVRIALELGIPEDVIRKLEHWQSSELVLFDERQRTILGYVDEVARDRQPPVHLREGLARYYPPEAIVGLNLLVGFYRMTGMFACAMELETEGRFVGWQLY